MPFIKGQSGNENGRPKGSKNKNKTQLRQLIQDFLEEKFEAIKTDFEKLTAKDRAKLFCDLLQYGIPKLSSTSLNLDLERLTEDELDKIIDELKASINNQQENPNPNE